MPVLQTQTRESFQIHFVVVAMLFLIFDLELVLLLPLGVTLSKISTFGFAVAVLFFLILTVGFILEIGSKAISISPQLPKNDITTSPSVIQDSNNFTFNSILI